MEIPREVAPESLDWQSAHYEEPFYSQRTAKLPVKLQRLGIFGMPRDIRVLDACCGRGEALLALRNAGFRNLVGIDATPRNPSPDDQLPLHHGDVKNMPFPDQDFDLILNLHALHHMGGPTGVRRFLQECHRVLRPGGTLAIIDFPASPQIRFLFWVLRRAPILPTKGLRNFARIVDEEWAYLGAYLQAWHEVKATLSDNTFSTAWKHQRFFLYYWRLLRV
jgi:SAM-dependent methyltransferase